MRLTITDEGTLMPVVLDREITPQEAEQIKSLFDSVPFVATSERVAHNKPCRICGGVDNEHNWEAHAADGRW